MSLVGTSVVTVLLVLGSIYLGYGLFRFFERKGTGPVIEPSGTAVGALMGLLAFMLAMAFSMGNGRLDSRRQFQMKEINTLGTLYLRTDLINTVERDRCRQLLREYTRLRVDAHADPTTVPAVLERSVEIQNELWAITTAFARANDSKETAALVVEAVNDVIDTYGERIYVMRLHISVAIWGALFGMTVLAMIAMGYQMGLSGKSSHLVNLILAVTFSSALIMIADLDRYGEGFFRIPSQPIIDFYQSIGG